MLHIKSFINNPYKENTYLLFDNSLECVLIDPGMYTAEEQNKVVEFIKENQLKPVLLLNTHCHIDHVLGNKFVFDQYGLKPQFHQDELAMLIPVPGYAPMRGLRYQVSPLPETFLPEAGTIKFGETELELIFAPGHSPAHLCFYSANDHILIGGDVLFREGIGSTDLPGANFKQLIQSIHEKLFVLPDPVIVYPGHGPETTIGYEKQNNPFLT